MTIISTIMESTAGFAFVMGIFTVACIFGIPLGMSAIMNPPDSIETTMITIESIDTEYSLFLSDTNNTDYSISIITALKLDNNITKGSRVRIVYKVWERDRGYRFSAGNPAYYKSNYKIINIIEVE